MQLIISSTPTLDELSEESDSPAVGQEPISSPTLTAVANTRVGEISTTKNTILSGAAVFRSALSLTQQHRPSLQPAAPRPRLIIRLPRRTSYISFPQILASNKVPNYRGSY